MVPNVVLSHTFQANFFPIYKGMKKGNDYRIRLATMVALIICGTMYLTVGMYIYILYGDALKANFLLCLEKP